MSTRDPLKRDKLLERMMPLILPGLLVPTGWLTSQAFYWARKIGWAKAAKSQRGTIPSPHPDAQRDGPGSMDDVVNRLNVQDFKPKPFNGYVSTMLRATGDVVPMYFDTFPKTRGRFFGYPRAFHETVIPGHRGVPISAVMGIHHAMLPRPTLLLVHGLLNSKGNDLIRVVALKAYYEWGFNVCAIDLRGFGRSASFMSVPTAGGGLEARDIMEAVKYLRKFPNVTTVGLLGMSLGGGAVINAAGLKGEPVEKLLDGGVLAVCPPLDFLSAIQRLENPPADGEYLFTYHIMHYLLTRMVENADLVRWARKRLAKEGGDDNIVKLSDYMKKLVAWGYLGQPQGRSGEDTEQLYRLLVRLTSPIRALKRARVPTLVLSSADDPLTRMSSDLREELSKLCDNNKHLQFIETQRGGHCGYAAVDQDWYYRALRIYFSYWAKWPTEKAHPFQ